ncbi:hypothetical protein L1049_004918 [Liquidambar formosana]|uniref:Receptor-like serine/threonine-protein kinase n=1 Tax=Liquidambar formosana TaxID=63359 RepID=A0AAP0WX22_LIQFO
MRATEKESLSILEGTIEAAENINSNAPNLQVFSFAKVVVATNNFSIENKLGQGGYGPVYKGELPNGQEIAVKRLSKTSRQGLTEFKNEVMLTGKLQHVNLVRLVGFCIEREEKMLIYEYMPNKSLDFYLFDLDRRLLLDWKKRVQIIEGITQGLLYLQEYSRLTILHRDLKSSNILLDNEMKPKISDLGMARILEKYEHEMNLGQFVGTYGYVPPECVKEGTYSVKSDVYSFGVLLLQIITSKKHGLYGSNENITLLEYAYELWKDGKGMEFMDPSLDDAYSPYKLMTCMQVALLCVQEKPEDRPSMLEVSSMLKNEIAAIAIPKRPAFSVKRDEDEFNDSRLQYARSAQQTQFNVSLGSFLTPTKNNSWFSPSGRFAFGFYQQANGYAVGIFLAGIPHKTIVWTANRDQPVSSNTTLQFTSSGSLILRSSQGREISIANTITAASYASMLDSGNFVLYSSDQEIIWQSFEHPTDTLLPGQRLSTEAKLISSVSETDHSTGMFCLRMQSDGNLVQYPVEYPYGKEYAYWSSNTYGHFSVTLNLDDDGHLYFLDGTGSNIKNLTDGYPMEKTIYLMRIDPDGIFRLYSHSLDENSKWSILWSSTTDRCDPKGLCGPNSYCVANDQKADCQCIPGFEFANQSNRSSGCKSNFIEDSCTKRHESIEYTIEELPNTEWRMDPYLVQSESTKDECKTACSEDCNCGAAVFRVGECSKLQLPLR